MDSNSFRQILFPCILLMSIVLEVQVLYLEYEFKMVMKANL